LKLVGVDTLSIDPIENGDFPAHRLLLSAGIVVVESLDLASVPERDYTLYCLPLKVVGAEAAPARAILVS
jgi:arylformamidase